MLEATSGDTLVFNQSRMAAWTSWACSGVATFPVPIAQTGSYAITTSAQFEILSESRYILHIYQHLKLNQWSTVLSQEALISFCKNQEISPA